MSHKHNTALHNKGGNLQVLIRYLFFRYWDLTAHLKNEDFFEVEKFPKATFKSASITEGSDAEGDWTHTVAGDFTIRGVTKRLTFPAKISVTDGEVTANTEFVMNRKDFGITYPGMPDNLIKDNVKMTISFVAPRA